MGHRKKSIHKDQLTNTRWMNISIRYSDHAITSFGGLTTVINFYQNCALQDVISSLPYVKTRILMNGIELM